MVKKSFLEEFFKVTWWKIIISIVFVLISSYIIFGLATIFSHINTGGQDILAILPTYQVLLIYLFIPSFMILKYLPSNMVIISYLTMQFVYGYLVICLLIFIIDEFKKRKKSK